MKYYIFLRTRYGQKLAFVFLALVIIFFAANPEAFGFIMLIQAIGVDVFLILLGIQCRQYFEMPCRIFIGLVTSCSMNIVNPILGFLKFKKR